MFKFNKIVSLVSLALIAACSGYEDSAQEEGFDDEVFAEELGQVEQAYVTQQATSGASRRWTGVLVSSGSTVKDTCQSLQAAGSQCFVPSSKTITVTSNVGGSGCTAASLANMKARVTEYVGSLSTALSGSGWSVTEVAGGATVSFFCEVGLVGGGTDVANYVRVDALGPGTLLTETLPGSFTKMPQWMVNVDGNAVEVLGTSALNDVKAMRHAVGHGLVKAFGVGRSSNSGFVSNAVISGSGDLQVGAFSAGELCRTRNYSTTGATSYATSQTANCSND